MRSPDKLRLANISEQLIRTREFAVLSLKKTNIFCLLFQEQAKDEQLKKSKIFEDDLQKTLQRFFLISANNTSERISTAPIKANAHKFFLIMQGEITTSPAISLLPVSLLSVGG